MLDRGTKTTAAWGGKKQKAKKKKKKNHLKKAKNLRLAVLSTVHSAQSILVLPAIVPDHLPT